MKDNFGDKIEVSLIGREINLAVSDFTINGGQTSDAALTPAKARKLAKKLRRAAKKAERDDLEA